MELHCQQIRAAPEGLVIVQVARGDEVYPLGPDEGVVVPVQDRYVHQVAQRRIQGVIEFCLSTKLGFL